MSTAREKLGPSPRSPGLVAQDSVEIERILTQLGAYYRHANDVVYEPNNSRSELGVPITGGGPTYPLEDMLADEKKAKIRRAMSHADTAVEHTVRLLLEQMVNLGNACGIRPRDWDDAEVRAHQRAAKRRGPGPKHGRRIRG